MQALVLQLRGCFHGTVSQVLRAPASAHTCLASNKKSGDSEMSESSKTLATTEETRRARVAVLQALAGIDTPPQEAVNVLTKLAASLCGAPFALVTLIDCERLCFHATYGLNADSMDRASSFCSDATDASEFLEVADARADPRFCNSSMVTGDLAIRFYAGVPLIVNGVAIGKLCILDRQPRQLTAEQREALNDLALLTTVILQARVDAFKTLSAVHSQF